MVCWEGNFKINSFQKHLSAKVIHKGPRLELIFSASLIFVIIGFSHIITILEEACKNTLAFTTSLLSWLEEDFFKW